MKVIMMNGWGCFRSSPAEWSPSCMSPTPCSWHHWVLNWISQWAVISGLCHSGFTSLFTNHNIYCWFLSKVLPLLCHVKTSYKQCQQCDNLICKYVCCSWVSTIYVKIYICQIELVCWKLKTECTLVRMDPFQKLWHPLYDLQEQCLNNF